jgi:hypothetical protein
MIKAMDYMSKANVLKFKGGLGNQLFIYALYLSLVRNSSNGCYVDFSHYRYMKNSGDIELENAFTIEIIRHESPEHLIKKLSNRDYDFFSKVLKRLFGSKDSHYTDLEQGFDPVVFTLSNHYIDGYWQSFRYFDYFREELVKHLVFKPFKNSAYLVSIVEKIKSSENSVSLHVRGGDYLKTNTFINLSKTNYYKNALEKLDFLNKTVFVFTDDIDFVLNNNYFDSFILVDTRGHENHLDMYLMSICNHNIVANSSYSWWSAYLNVNPRKLVIAPSEWFNNRNINLDDLYPDTWLIANVR